MLSCAPHNVSVFYVEIKLGATPDNIPKGNFPIAFNRILPTPVLPLRDMARKWLYRESQPYHGKV
jgi:hypothetical protein